MAVSLAIWSLELRAGEDHAQEIRPPGDLRITNIALGSELADETGRTTLKLVYLVESSDDEDGAEDDEDELDGEPVETTICTLIPGQIEQVNTDIILPADQAAVFASIGKNTIHLTGNYIDQLLPDEPPSDDELMDGDMDDMSGDDSGEDDNEDVPEPEPVVAESASKKRARKPEATEDVDDSKLSKKERKKLKAQNGEAVLVSESTSAKTEKNTTEKGKKEKVKGTGVERELAGGVKVLDHKVGTGPKAKTGDNVAMRYVGKLDNGKVFDSNTKGKAFEFTVGNGDVIKGWDIGIAGMQAGGERLLTIPPAMGYGKKKQGDIPANSTLIFEVKLLRISDA